jgi:hypothetical protein
MDAMNYSQNEKLELRVAAKWRPDLIDKVSMSAFVVMFVPWALLTMRTDPAGAFSLPACFALMFWVPAKIVKWIFSL